jgi:hypothetical protein
MPTLALPPGLPTVTVGVASVPVPLRTPPAVSSVPLSHTTLSPPSVVLPDGETFTSLSIYDRYKTKLCCSFTLQGTCPYDRRCMYAHGESDLRSAEENHVDGIVSQDTLRAFLIRKTGIPPPVVIIDPAEAMIAERFKTKMCRGFTETGSCPYEERCMFAHGDAELRTKEMNIRDELTSEVAVKQFQREQQTAKRDAQKRKDKWRAYKLKRKEILARDEYFRSAKQQPTESGNSAAVSTNDAVSLRSTDERSVVSDDEPNSKFVAADCSRLSTCSTAHTVSAQDRLLDSNRTPVSAEASLTHSAHDIRMAMGRSPAPGSEPPAPPQSTGLSSGLSCNNGERNEQQPQQQPQPQPLTVQLGLVSQPQSPTVCTPNSTRSRGGAWRHNPYAPCTSTPASISTESFPLAATPRSEPVLAFPDGPRQIAPRASMHVRWHTCDERTLLSGDAPRAQYSSAVKTGPSQLSHQSTSCGTSSGKATEHRRTISLP